MDQPAACLFDLDGLLLDTEPLHAQAWRQAAAHWGLRLDDQQLLQLRGRRRQDNVAQLLAWMAADGGPVPEAAELMAVQQPIVRRLLPTASPIDGAPELLAACQARGLPMALVTSSTRESLAVKMAPHPWLAVIQLQVVGDDPELERGKPAPDPFLLAARRLGVPATACWAFEDSPAGARSALAAGCRVHVLPPPGLALNRYPAAVSALASLHEISLGV
ncbi:MAG: HAD family phosphatase [Cyanobacteriota bacterium]|nr:HAD family phosphatase [Cyanobacteriota bacterium]